MTNREEVHVDRLNAEVAILLKQERGQLPHLNPQQCYAVIETLGRMQDDRDAEVYNLLKPSLDQLRTVVTHMNMWKSLMSLPRSDLLKALSSHVKTDMGIKTRSFQLQGRVLMAIEASNEIHRALEVEKEASGLSKVLVKLMHEVKQIMEDIQDFLVDLMRHTQRSPSTAAVYFRPLKVGLRKGIPSYLDPDRKVLKTASSKHPLVKTAGSEWNKWFHRHDTKFIRVARDRDEFYMKFYVPEGPILELREAFKAAEVTEPTIELERMLTAQPLAVSQGKQDDATKTSEGFEGDNDIEYLEDLEWDFTTYLKILDHKKVDYLQAGDDFIGREPDHQFYEDPMNVSDRELRRFLLPDYSGIVMARHERIFHPADIELFVCDA
ncbi:hypothetical protein DL546_003170 [Coniochaeta pulveracea]|uniref:Uncharacterized protein n=1 Tax=Coniochaeta pulveracea TaxID=177199 RepID=A0A420Y290_9PEZI|nr:hypothetical protein DL546_003170 [Coniochaeta pulveracea]